MRVLCMTTSTPASSVALTEDRQVVASASRIDARGHSAFLVPAIDFCFDQAGWTPMDIDAVVVDVGPGLYTGIRVGLSTAQGIAAAIGAPLVPATSLDAIALRAATGRRRILALVDVRRGEYAAAWYNPVPGGVVKDGRPEIMTAPEVRAMLDSEPEDVLLVGDTQSLPEELLTGMHRVKIGRPRYPNAGTLAEAAAGQLLSDATLHPDDVRPMYLRDPDVSINWSIIDDRGPWARLEGE